jgi:hypothetical protein
MSGPSERALAAVEDALDGPDVGATCYMDWPVEMVARKALDAAHDETLGLDRSMCLRDLVAMLRAEDAGWGADTSGGADWIVEQFGGDQEPPRWTPVVGCPCRVTLEGLEDRLPRRLAGFRGPGVIIAIDTDTIDVAISDGFMVRVEPERLGPPR